MVDVLLVHLRPVGSNRRRRCTEGWTVDRTRNEFVVLYSLLAYPRLFLSRIITKLLRLFKLPAIMSDLKATVEETKNGFHVEGYEKIEYDFTFLDGVFNTANPQLAQCYERWGRCLAVMDLNIFNIYGEEMQRYFDHHQLPLTIHKTMIGEKAKSMETLLSIVDSMTDFGIIRKEPVLVVVYSVIDTRLWSMLTMHRAAGW